MAQENMKTQTFDEPIRGGGGILFKEFIEKNIFKTSLRDLFLEMVRKPSIAECLAMFTNHSSNENELEDDVLEHLVGGSCSDSEDLGEQVFSRENELEDDVLEHFDEGSCSDSEDLGEEVFSTLLLPHVVVPRFSLPKLEVPSDEEDSDISE